MTELEVRLAVDDPEVQECPDCGGYGEVPYSSDGIDCSFELCVRCKGTGKIPVELKREV